MPCLESDIGSAEIGARLDRLPSSRYLWRLISILAFGGFFEFYDLMMTAYVSPGLFRSGTFSEQHGTLFGLSDQATFGSATFAGLWVGTLFLGSIADRYGRRAVFTFALLWYSLGTVTMAFQGTAAGIFVWRFIASIGIGCEMVTINTYLSEIVPKIIRGRAFAISASIHCVAVPVVAFLAWLLLPRRPLGIEGWRWVVVVPGLAALVVWWIRQELPESPRWLAQNGRLLEAQSVITAIEKRVGCDVGDALPPVKVGVDRPSAMQFHGIRELFRASHRRDVVMLVVFNIFQTIGFYGFANWVPKLISSQGFDITRSLKYSFIIAIAYPIGPLLFALFADRFERKWQIVVAATATAVFGLLFSRQTDATPLIVCGVLLTMSTNLMAYAYHAYQPELFPTRIRARAVGFVYSFSRLSAIFSGFMIAYVLHHFGTPGVFVFIAMSMLIVTVVIGVFGPLTRNRTLEEITDHEAQHRSPLDHHARPCEAES